MSGEHSRHPLLIWGHSMEEIWKDVVGYEGLYEVSNLGRVRSLPRTITVQRNGFSYQLPLPSKVLKPQPLRHGYVGVWLYGKDHIDGRNGKNKSVHRIVAEAFCKREDGKNEVNHLNEIKNDNRAENLEWCDRVENCNYGTRGERLSKAGTNGKQSKPVFQFTPDGKLVAEYPSMAEVQRSTGFRKGNIWKQMVGKYETAYGYKWSH